MKTYSIDELFKLVNEDVPRKEIDQLKMFNKKTQKWKVVTEYQKVNRTKALLDELFPFSWSWEILEHFRDERGFHLRGELTVQWKDPEGAIITRKYSGTSSVPRVQHDFPRAEGFAISNGAKKVGRRFGRDLGVGQNFEIALDPFETTAPKSGDEAEKVLEELILEIQTASDAEQFQKVAKACKFRINQEYPNSPQYARLIKYINEKWEAVKNG